MGADGILKWRRSSLIGFLLLPILLLFCIAYYFSFAVNLDIYDAEEGLFQLGLNAHDHFIYLANIDFLRTYVANSDSLRDGFVLYEMANDKGIGAIYWFLSELFPFFVDPNFILLSLLFNCVTICGCYWVYSDICDQLKLGVIGKLSFFANTYFIYFSQLINKDLLTILTFLFAVLCGLRGRVLPLLLLLPVMVLVRQQLIIFVLIFIYLMPSQRPWPKILSLYVITSILAGLLSVFFSVIGSESLEGGFNAYLVEFNQKYYVGYLLFNPIRVVQYVQSAYSSFLFGTETGGYDLAKILRLPQLILLMLLLKPLSKLFTRFDYLLTTSARPMLLALVAYLLTWLINPTVNARYVMLITPVLVLFALYVRRQQQRGLL